MKVAFVLSGGGSRGIAHIGVIKALGEMGVKPSMISGASVGALIGAYFAAGYDADEIFKMALSIKLFSLSGINFGVGGIFKPVALRDNLEKHLKDMTFENLSIPLYVAATDFINVETVYYSSGELIPVLLATSAIPGIYSPVEFEGKFLVDGGLLNNFPIEPIEGKSNFIIGSHVNPVNKSIEKLNVTGIIDRSFHIAILNTVSYKRERCALFIEPPALSGFGLFEVKHAQEIFDIGYSHTMSMKKDIELLFKKD